MHLQVVGGAACVTRLAVCPSADSKCVTRLIRATLIMSLQVALSCDILYKSRALHGIGSKNGRLQIAWTEFSRRLLPSFRKAEEAACSPHCAMMRTPVKSLERAVVKFEWALRQIFLQYAFLSSKLDHIIILLSYYINILNMMSRANTKCIRAPNTQAVHAS